MIEFMGACGKKIAVDPNSVDYIQESVLMDIPCTLLCFKNSKKIFVNEKYDIVKKQLKNVVWM